MSPEDHSYWLYIEKQITEDREQTKYADMVIKGLYVTDAEAEAGLAEKNKVVNFDYIALPNTLVADSMVQVTESDLKAYYEEHKDRL